MGFEKITSDAANDDVPDPYVVYRGSLEALLHKYGTVSVPGLQYLYKKEYGRFLDYIEIGFTIMDEFLTDCRDLFYINKLDNVWVLSLPGTGVAEKKQRRAEESQSRRSCQRHDLRAIYLYYKQTPQPGQSSTDNYSSHPPVASSSWSDWRERSEWDD